MTQRPTFKSCYPREFGTFHLKVERGSHLVSGFRGYSTQSLLVGYVSTSGALRNKTPQPRPHRLSNHLDATYYLQYQRFVATPYLGHPSLGCPSRLPFEFAGMKCTSAIPHSFVVFLYSCIYINKFDLVTIPMQRSGAVSTHRPGSRSSNGQRNCI